MQTEPERELVRRVVPFGPPVVAATLLIGAVAGGWGAGWSAAIGVAIVFANFAIHGWSLSRAARISPAALSAVALGGFVIRLGVIVAMVLLLNRLAFFSPTALAAAVIPTTILLLVYELKLLAGPVGQQWRIPEEQAAP